MTSVEEMRRVMAHASEKLERTRKLGYQHHFLVSTSDMSRERGHLCGIEAV